MNPARPLTTPPTILFGRGTRRHIAEHSRAFGQRVFLVTGSRSLAASGEQSFLQEQLSSRGMTSVPFVVSGEPDVALVDEGARLCVAEGCELVIGIGGGSVLDAAKAVASLIPNGGSALDYLQDVPGKSGKDRVVTKPSLPFVAVPTTAGSGSEVTKNAVLRIPEAALKRSMRSELMMAHVALVDPELSRDAPSHVSAPAALDALTHLLEGYVSRDAHPATDTLAFKGMKRSLAALHRIAGGATFDAEVDDLAMSSLWGGVVLANAGLGAVHGLVAPLGGRFPIPHGCGCGALLAPTFRVNVTALRQRDPGGLALTRYRRVAEVLAGPDATLDAAADALDALRVGLGAHPLAHYGVTHDSLAGIIAGARGGSMKSNPIVLTDAELETILRESMGPLPVRAS